MNKVFLIGMPGSGKSTTGIKLSNKLGRKFIDLDTEIETKVGLSISEIFQTRGEDFFRSIEHDALIEVINFNKSFVLACGGGTPCYHNGMNVMNQNGITFFLDVSIPTIIERLANKNDRPLLKESCQEEKLINLYQTRIDTYLKSHFTISESSDNIDEIISLLN